MDRYARYELLDGFGAEGVERLRSARVLVVGLGGLGSGVAAQMAAAGVGSFTLLDGDHVSASDLARQLLYTPADVGELKVAVASEQLRRQNPECEVTAIPQWFDEQTELGGFDLIVDGLDCWASRRILNRRARRFGIPVVFGAAQGYVGYAMAMDAGSPCLECLWSDSPGSGCDTLGVYPPAVALAAAIQANLGLQRLALGDWETGVAHWFDARRMRFRRLTFSSRPGCPGCSDRADDAPIAQTPG